jgi:hypothetical protein
MMIYILTKSALRIIKKSAYDEGVQNCYKLCREMYVGKGIISNAFNPKLRKELDEILKQKGLDD